jgi:riboflavin synthase
MFTGLIETIGTVAAAERGGKLWVRMGIGGTVGPGDSIAVNGVCLTVVTRDEDRLQFELSEETLSKTTLGSRPTGCPLNLELPLRANAALGGHFVQGHVDGMGELVGIEALEGSWLLRFSLPAELYKELVPKGSVAIDGISLTVVDLLPGNEFSVAIIPHTWKHTNLSSLTIGDRVNVETDILGKYVLRYLETSGQRP